MDTNVTFPLDGGFLRRECPSCQRQFKWHHGEAEGRPADEFDPEVYWCPYCGETAAVNAWWTAEQATYIRESLSGPVLRELADQLGASLGPQHGNLVKVAVDYTEPEPPHVLHEPHDMVAVQSPCHPWEPVKIDGSWSRPLYCIVCGRPFALA